MKKNDLSSILREGKHVTGVISTGAQGRTLTETQPQRWYLAAGARQVKMFGFQGKSLFSVLSHAASVDFITYFAVEALIYERREQRDPHHGFSESPGNVSSLTSFKR